MTSSAVTHRVLLYSSEQPLRDTLRTAIGRRPAPELGRVELVEAATLEEVLAAVDEGGIDVAVLDGESRPAGGLGIAKQLKDELEDAPPTLVLVARPGDAWLADWSLADAVQPLPVDAPALCAAVADLLRHRENALPVRRAAAR